MTTKRSQKQQSKAKKDIIDQSESEEEYNYDD